MMFLKILLFLNANSGAFAVIFSCLVAFATIVYAIITWKLFSETKRLREAQTEPQISISIQAEEKYKTMMDMVIQNIGLGSAYDIEFDISKDFLMEKYKTLSEINIFKKGIKCLAPNQKIQFFLINMHYEFEEKVNTPIEINVIYKNSSGNEYKDHFVIDFSKYIDLYQYGTPPFYKIADNIQRIQNDIHKISNGFQRLQVNIYNNEDREKEKLIMEHYKKKSEKKDDSQEQSNNP